MIRLQNLTLQRGPQRLLEDAELTLHAGHKAGLIGANGAGKSSLFALIRGELHPDSGDCLLPAVWRIAHMRHEFVTLERLAVVYVLDGDLLLLEVQRDLAAAEAAHDGAAQARLHSELDSADGYTADARARKLLAGLGFTNEHDGSPGRRFLRWLADASEPGSGFDVPLGPFAARRTDQPLGPRRHYLARRVAQKLPGHFVADFPRPGLS